MFKLTTVLGMPQHRFASIHVVGTNGKSSVTRMIAALLEAHGVSAGASVSPHASRWAERTLIHGEEIGVAEFEAAVTRVALASEVVNRSLAADEQAQAGVTNSLRRGAPGELAADAITQFEAATAASFVALAAAGVQVGVIEAGLGGRLDATNTIPSRVCVLTSIGRDHTEWLGETETEIAAEKLAVLRDHSSLVLGAVSPAVEALAESVAATRGAALIRAPLDLEPGLELRALGAFQRRNFSVAMAAAEAFMGELDPTRVARVAANLTVPGRLEQISNRPPVFIDAAHNPDGAAALAEALQALGAGPPRIACLAILRDKDAAEMLAALAPVLDRVICSELPAAALAAQGRPGAASHPAAELAALGAERGLEAEAVPELAAALQRSRELALSLAGAMVIVSGSHYLLEPARRLLLEAHQGAELGQD